jgi:hypothetical protein
VDEIALPEGFYYLEVSFWLMASMIGRGGLCPFQLYPGICLTTEENTEKLSQGSRLVLHKSLRRLGRHFRGSINWPAERQILVYPPVTSVCSAGQNSARQGWAGQSRERKLRAGQSTAVKCREGQGKTRQGGQDTSGHGSDWLWQGGACWGRAGCREGYGREEE